MNGNSHFGDGSSEQLPYGYAEPDDGYSFDGQDLEGIGHGLPSFDTYRNDAFADFDPAAQGNPGPPPSHHAHQPPTSQTPHIASPPMPTWHPTNPSPHYDFTFTAALHPPSAQTDIASVRDSVGQRFGQVTPPDEVVKSGIGLPPKRKRSISEEADAQRQRQERARNAAHTRHSRNSTGRKYRKDSGEGGEGVGDGEEEVDKADSRRDKYREKNRVAAAKCRSKKKASVDDLNDRFRRMQAENNYKKRQVRQLRDELSGLRELALIHGPDVCGCGPIHQYNKVKAAEMAMEQQRINAMQMQMQQQQQNLSSPSHDGASTMLSPISDVAPTFDGGCASIDGVGDAGGMHSSAGQQPSKPAMANALIATRPSPSETMMGTSMSQDEFPMFAEFLESSSPGDPRAGFV